MTTPLSIEQPAYFDRLAEVETTHWWSLGMWRLAAYWLGSAVRGRRGLRALDVGCGTGATTLRLARRPEIGSVVGLEPSPAALAHARGIALVRASALALPFEGGRFDVVTCFDVLQHLPEGGDRRAVSELRRVLRRGGVALVRSNARGWGAEPERPGGGYRLGDLVEIFEQAGLAVERATHANCLPALAQEVRGRLFGIGRQRDGAGPHPAGAGLRIRMPHPLVNRLMGGVSAAEAAVAGRFPARLPFGHSTMILARCVA